MQRFFGRWSIFGVTLLAISLLLFNYFNFLPLSKLFPFLSFLPHKTQLESIPTSVPPPVWQRGTQAIREGKIASPERILEVNLNYDETASPDLRIVSVNIKNGYSPKYPPQDKGYQLQLFDKQNKLVSSLTFTIPNKIAGIPPPLEGEERATIDPQDLIPKKVDFTLTVLNVETAKTLQILDPQAKVVAIQDLANVPIIDNKPNFESIPGANVSNKQSSILDFLFSRALAESPDGKLDITFIGNGYSGDMEQFGKDVDRFRYHLLTFYEPFRTRASQLSFHKVDNNVDLKCEGSILHCDYSLVMQQVNNSGVPYDRIVVISSTSKFGGSSMGLISVTHSKEFGESVFVHELGHAVADLHDEYLSSSIGGSTDNKVDKNCYRGTPTTEVWPGIPQSEYTKGCDFPNWYRSSKRSIMTKINVHFFNAVSQRILNEAIDSYAGTFSGIIPTPPSTFEEQEKVHKQDVKQYAYPNCIVTFDWSTEINSPALSGGPPYTVTPDNSNPSSLPLVKTEDTLYTYNNALPGEYGARICDVRGSRGSLRPCISLSYVYADCYNTAKEPRPTLPVTPTTEMTVHFLDESGEPFLGEKRIEFKNLSTGYVLSKLIPNGVPFTYGEVAELNIYSVTAGKLPNYTISSSVCYDCTPTIPSYTDSNPLKLSLTPNTQFVNIYFKYTKTPTSSLILTPSPTPTIFLTPIPTPTLTTVKGDVDGNGCIDIIDLNILATAIQTQTIKQGMYPDVNSDGDIDIVDLNILSNVIQQEKNICQ